MWIDHQNNFYEKEFETQLMLPNTTYVIRVGLERPQTRSTRAYRLLLIEAAFDRAEQEARPKIKSPASLVFHFNLIFARYCQVCRPYQASISFLI
jgi:hypothetical protein